MAPESNQRNENKCVTVIRARPRFYRTPGAIRVNLSLDLEPRQNQMQHAKKNPRRNTEDKESSKYGAKKRDSGDLQSGRAEMRRDLDEHGKSGKIRGGRP